MVGVGLWALDVALFSDAVVQASGPPRRLVLVGAAPVLAMLILRRRHPLPVALLVIACVPSAMLVLGWSPVLSVALVVGTAAARTSLRASLTCLFIALGAHAFVLVEEVNQNPQLDRTGALLGVGGIYALIDVGAWALGRWSASNRRRAAELERQRDRALADERARVSRELHDIVAHAVTVILLHAAVGRRAFERGSSKEVLESLGVIEEVGGQAVNELRRMLGLLRPDMRTDGVRLLPNFEALPELIDGFRKAGVDVELRTRGKARGIDPSVGLAAFRAVQESLTNALRHGGTGVRATVEVTWSDGSLGLRIVDDGGGRPDPRVAALSTGTGLVGLRERVAIVGGRMSVGPRDGDGWQIELLLPTARDPNPPGAGLGGEYARELRNDGEQSW